MKLVHNITCRLISLLVASFVLFAIRPAQAQKFVNRSIKDFGAKGDGVSDDQDAFAKASAFFNKRKGAGRLKFPAGVYIVGRQHFTGEDVLKSSPSYSGEHALDLVDCSNLTIEGSRGAIIRFRDSLRLGTFSPVTGEPFKHSITGINVKQGYAHYPTTVGITMRIRNSRNIVIRGLTLEGNVDGFIFGGNWGNGRNAYELIHYGIYLVDCNTVQVKHCNIRDYACDGIYIANLGEAVKTFNIEIDHCQVDYCGRNGLSWLGGENIRVYHSSFSNSGQGTVHESPAAGIDIEVENNSFCRKGYFYDCTMLNNVGSAITSGSGKRTHDVLFKKCLAASPGYYTVFADASRQIFEDCRLYGTVLVWFRASGDSDAVKFKRCRFEDSYLGKAMYNGNYQLGAEASALQVDDCSFISTHSSSYYLKGLMDDCTKTPDKMIRVSNSRFYNYSTVAFPLVENAAGIAGNTVFYNNLFYAKPSKKYLNSFDGKCNADAGRNTFFVLSNNARP